MSAQVLDASTLLADFCSKERAEELTARIEAARVIVLEKVDHVMAARREGLIALITALNPGATIIEGEARRGAHAMSCPSPAAPNTATAAASAAVEADRPLPDGDDAPDTSGLALAFTERAFPNAGRFGISTLLYRERRPFHPARFAQFLDADWPGVVRAAGIFWLASRPDWSAELSQAGAARRYRAVTSWWATTLRGRTFTPEDIEPLIGVEWDAQFGDRRQHLAFVGLHLDTRALKERLDACVLTDAELRGGMDRWQDFADPFPPWGVVADIRAAARYH